NRVTSSDAKLSEKTAAWLVTTAMKAERKLGMGLVPAITKKKKKKKTVKFNKAIVKHIEKVLAQKKDDLANIKSVIKTARTAAKAAVKKVGGSKKYSSTKSNSMPENWWNNSIPFTS